VPELLAAVRPDDQSFALLLHLVGATVTFGALLASATFLLLARGETRLLRLGYYSLLLVALPGWILMRLAGEWLYRLQHWNDLPDQIDQPVWLTIGHIVADWGGLLFLLALALGGLGIRRLRNDDSSTALLRATTLIALVLIAAYVVAVWAMTGKPN
jgi:succinate dehydrogenase hydrophobic anchor subunit